MITLCFFPISINFIIIKCFPFNFENDNDDDNNSDISRSDILATSVMIMIIRTVPSNKTKLRYFRNESSYY